MIDNPIVFVAHVDNAIAWSLVEKTQLPFSTVRSMLLRGWTYEESINSWLRPIEQKEI